MVKSQNKVQRMVTIAMLSAVSLVLMFFAFPVLPAFSFMAVDFSEIPILIGAYLMGPVAGISIAALRSILHLLVTGASVPNLIGDFTSFLAAISLVLPIYWITKNNHTTKKLYLGLGAGVLTSTLVMMAANYTFVLPLYAKFAGFILPGTLANYILLGVLPFNLIKGLLVSTVFIVVHRAILPWLLNKKQKNKLHI